MAAMTKSRRARQRQAAAPRVDLATKPTARPPTEERGTSGSVSWGGVMSSLSADYAAAWQMPRRWTTIETMRADPAVTAALAALTFPILGAALTVDGASDDPEDAKLAEFVEEGLANMTTDLATHRMETLDSVGDGVSVFYTRYEQREDGLWHLRKLKLLPNKSITEWNVDEDHGGPEGVTQTLPSGSRESFTMDELLVFTHMRRGDSLLGRPALRAMYRPWFLIDKLSRIGAIAVERGASGTPWARYTGGSDTEGRKLDRALQGLHAQERAYLRVDEDVPDWGIKGIEGATIDPVPLMEYQRRDLFLAPLAQFLALGSDGVGSMALSGDHSNFFMLALQFIARELEDVYNRYLIPRWIGYNWTVPADRLPRVTHGAIDRRDVGAWTQAVAAMVGAGIPLPMDALAEEATRYLGITVPEREAQADVGGVADVNDPNAPEAGTAGGAGGQAVDQRAGGLWPGVALAGVSLKSPIMLEALGVAVDFAGMASALDEAEARIIRDLAPLQEAQRRRLVNAARKIVRDGDAEAIDRFTIQHDQEEAAILAALVALYETGGQNALAELESQDVKPSRVDRAVKAVALAYLAVVAAEAARSLADRLRTAWGTAVVGQIQTGYNAEVLAAAITAPGDRLLADVARRGSSTALGMGRSDAVEANADKVGREVWSAVLDENSCAPCRALDGEEFDVGEGPTVPYAECLGGARCRCLRIPIVSER